MIVLCLLARSDRYGFELVTEISQNIHMSEGTIYPLLKRLKDGGFLETYWQESANGAPRKYYRATPQGRNTATQLQGDWYTFVDSVGAILNGEEAVQ